MLSSPRDKRGLMPEDLALLLGFFLYRLIKYHLIRCMIMYKMSETKEQLSEDYSIYIFLAMVGQFVAYRLMTNELH